MNYVEPAAGAGPAPAPFSLPRATSTEGDALLTRIATFPLPAREMIYLGVKKLIDYQDSRYAHLYLDRLQSLQVFEGGDDAALTTETARFLALWMAFEDLPRVAQIKISPERFERFREEVRAQQGQQVGMVEFLHPRVEEFCGIMPAGLGRYVLDSPSLRRIIGLFAKPRNVRTNSLPGFLLFYLMSGLRRFRRSSLVYQLEHAHMERWLDAIRSAAPADRERAVELARCGRLIKGYGATRERGTGNMQRILAVCERLPGLSAPSVRALREAALSGEDGAALTALEGELLAAR